MSGLTAGIQLMTIKDLPNELEIKRRAFRVSMLTELADFYKWTLAFQTSIPECDVKAVLNRAYAFNGEATKNVPKIVDDEILGWFFEATVTKNLRSQCNGETIVQRISRLCDLLQILTSDVMIKDTVENLRFIKGSEKNAIADLDRGRHSIMICGCDESESELCEIILKNNPVLKSLNEDWGERAQNDQRLVEFLKLVRKVDFGNIEPDLHEEDDEEEEEMENFSSFCACSEHMGATIGNFDHELDHVHGHGPGHGHSHSHAHNHDNGSCHTHSHVIHDESHNKHEHKD